ncbi:MAG: hypothetical protein JNM14_10855 [Ferruginibacter sp.]|nr:hypothetical protein [Ferruginibacter sp.]
MNDFDKIEKVGKKVSFAEAEELEVEYYASVDWKESAKKVEQMRRMIWSKEYEVGMVKIMAIAGLKDERNDIK